ncbi:MAG TPA: phage head closure protein [Buttiauxella sp.]|nr:phage head closure protein [Buttiauxella sp.]
MQAGGLRNRVTIKNFKTVELPSGQESEQWEDGATAWADIRSISGRELLTSSAETAEATIRVWMRFRRDVTAVSQLLVLTGPLKGMTLNIIGPPIPDPKGIQMEILCKQGVEQ